MKDSEGVVIHKMNEGYRAWEELKNVLSYRGLGIKVKKCLCEEKIAPTTLYTEQRHGVREMLIERRKVNVLECH